MLRHGIAWHWAYTLIWFAFEWNIMTSHASADCRCEEGISNSTLLCQNPRHAWTVCPALKLEMQGHWSACDTATSYCYLHVPPLPPWAVQPEPNSLFSSIIGGIVTSQVRAPFTYTWTPRQAWQSSKGPPLQSDTPHSTQAPGIWQVLIGRRRRGGPSSTTVTSTTMLTKH